MQQNRQGQQVLIEYEFPTLSLQPGFKITDGILETINQYDKPILLKDLIVALIEKYGITYATKEYKEKLLEMDEDKIEILRKPATTEKGRKAKSMDYDNYEITIKLK